MLQLNKPDSPALASYILALVALFLVLQKGLLAALLSGLLVYSLVHLIAPLLGRNISSQRARMLAVALVSSLVVAGLSLGVWAAVSFFQSEAGSLPKLMKKLADIIETSRTQIPDWLHAYLPQNADTLHEMVTRWLREHAGEATKVGEQAGRIIAHILIGMVIGAMAALYDTTVPRNYLPLAAALHQRVVNLSQSFQQVVFAQVRIAAINALFTGIFLLVALPLADVRLPLSKTMVVVTFIAGLLPVIGNLISNTFVVIVSLSHSLQMAVIALLFLITIHKLEYFLNAKIIGVQINSRAWELLTAMLVMESIFGLPGIVAAPVFYAYVKRELAELRLV